MINNMHTHTGTTISVGTDLLTFFEPAQADLSLYLELLRELFAEYCISMCYSCVSALLRCRSIWNSAIGRHTVVAVRHECACRVPLLSSDLDTIKDA